MLVGGLESFFWIHPNVCLVGPTFDVSFFGVQVTN